MQRINANGGFLDLAANNLRDQLRRQLSKGAAGSFTLNNIGHLASDGSNLGRSGIGGLLDLVGPSLGESDGEKTNEVVISRLNSDIGFDQSLPLANQRSKFVGSEVQAVEVGQAVLALDLVDAEANLAEGVLFILLEIGQRDLDDAALQSIVCVLETSGTVHKGLADTILSS